MPTFLAEEEKKNERAINCPDAKFTNSERIYKKLPGGMRHAQLG